MTTIPERVATLEANERTTEKAIQDIVDTMHSIDKKVGEINIKVEKSMSFIGGMAFTFSLLGGVFAVAAKYILGRIGVEF